MKSSLNFLSFALKFKEGKISEKFGNETLIFQKNCFKPLLGILMLLSSYSIILNADKNHNLFKETMLPVLSILLCFSAYYKIVTKYFSKYIEIALCIIIVAVIIYPMEFVKREGWDRYKMHSFSSALQLIIVLLVILRVSWRRYCLLIVGLQAYFNLREFSFKQMQDSNMHPLMAFVTHSLILVITHYSSERELKRQFNARYMHECTLKAYRTILTQIIPSAAIIIKDKEIIFSNEATASLLPHTSKSDLQSKLNEIRVKAPSCEELNVPLLTDMEFLQGSKTNLPDTDDCVDLKNIIQEYNMSDSFSKSPQFRFYQGYFKRDSCSNRRKNKKMLDIQIGDFIWDKERVVLILLNDVSANLRIQYLKTIGEYKDKLLSTVSHELRTPLNGLTGMLEIASEKLFDRPFERKLLNMSMKSANMLLFMINDILDYAQISSGKLRLNLEALDIFAAVKEASKLIKFQAKKKNLEFKIINNTKPGIGLYCNTDRNRVKQILLNLLGNSLKFTSKGFIKVELTRSSNDGPVTIAVEDSGVGIKEEDKGKLFKLFGKLEQSDKNINKCGVGLGLAVSQSLVKMINDNRGEITLMSEYGEGSKFQFPIFSKLLDLPFPNCSHEVIINEEDPIFQPIKFPEYKNKFICSLDEILHFEKREKKLVLIVDDDQINIMAEVNLLKTIDYCAHEIAYNGKEAIEKIIQFKKKNKFFDLILMDCNMPVMDGFQASRIIREMIGKKKIPDLKIVAVTANTSENDERICKASGMDYFLTKPLRKNDLSSLIYKICFGEEFIK